VFAKATANPHLHQWVVSYDCPSCQQEHSYQAGPLIGTAQGGVRQTYCGTTVLVKVNRVKPG
jgi:DNA-directed RNA polymerase subunit RPC12/RpoP